MDYMHPLQLTFSSSLTCSFLYPLVCVPLLVFGWIPSAQTLKRRVVVRGA